MGGKGETIWVNAVLYIVFECTTILQCDCISVTRYFIWEYGLITVKKRIHNHVNTKKRECIIQVTRSPVIFAVYLPNN